LKPHGLRKTTNRKKSTAEVVWYLEVSTAAQLKFARFMQ